MPRYWSTANLKDNQPNGWCELAWSTLQEIVGDALFAALFAVGYPVPPGIEVVRRFHGRGFFDLTEMQFGFYEAFGVLPHQISETIGGQQPEIEVPPNPLRGAAGRRRRMATLRLAKLIWNLPRKTKPLIQRHFQHQRRITATDFTRCSFAEIEQVLREIALI